MPTDLISRLQAGAVLCDGAMGTLLYSKGIFINRCYDELNVSQPDLIRDIHQEYLHAGAGSLKQTPLAPIRFVCPSTDVWTS